MPCGQADRRLKRRRCVYCQREHAKCDGARPCSTCLKRGVKCTSYVQPSKFNIVVYRHPSPPRHISRMPMNQPLVDGNTKYIAFFFNLVESSASPFIQLFSFASIGELFGSNELVQDTVNLVGKAYVSQGGPSSSFSKSSSQLKHDSRRLLAKLRVKVFKLLKSPVKKPRDFTASLISACLLQFVELLLYDSGSTWSSLVYQLLSTIPPEDVVSGFDDNHDHDHGELLSYLDYRLRLFLRTSGAFWALCFGNDVFWTLAKQTPEPLPPRPDVPLNIMLHNADKHWEDLAGSLEECGKLQYQLQSWINELSNPTPKSNGSTEVQGPHSPASHILNGIELVNRASQCQQRIISIIILYSTPTSSLSQDPFCRSLLPYYYWLLTSLSHIFLHPAWRILSVRLPVMTQSLARQQAERAFEYVEDNIQSLKLEAVAYAPILHIIGWQFSADLLERDRVLAVVESLRSSGYSVADRVEKDLQCQWASAEKGD